MPAAAPSHDGTSRFAGRLALLSYAAFVVYQTLAGGGTWACGGQVLDVHARFSRTDLLANVVAYVPLGLLAMLAMRPGRRSSAAAVRRVGMPIVAAVVAAVAGAALLSLVLEVAQSCLSARVSSPFDWAANTFGGLVGAIGGALLTTPGIWRRPPAAMLSEGAHGRLRLLTIAVAVGWVVSQTMPWVFSVDVGTVRSNLSFVKRWQGLASFDVWTVARHAGAWIAVASAWRLASSTRRGAVVATTLTAAASVALQLCLDASSPLSFDETLGMLLAATIAGLAWYAAGPAPRPRFWAGLLFGAAMVTVAAYELRPVPGAAVQAFSWWPRVGLGGLRGALDYAMLFGWFGAAVVVASRWRRDATGHGDAGRLWPLTAIAAMLAFEAVQTGIPGRGPDISAPLFTALAVLTTQALLTHRS